MNLSTDQATEYFSTENSEYWKLSNGLLICRGTLNKLIKTMIESSQSPGVYYDDGYGISFPYSFKDSNYSVSVTNVTGSLIHVYSVTGKGISNCSFNLLAHKKFENTAQDFCWIAIGRWK